MLFKAIGFLLCKTGVFKEGIEFLQAAWHEMAYDMSAKIEVAYFMVSFHICEQNVGL